MPENVYLPFTFNLINAGSIMPDHYDHHIERRLSAMRGQFLSQQAANTMLNDEDPVLYEVYEIDRPRIAGELLHGLSIVHPGKVGSEYFMTKGHFHTVMETAEIYYCLRGQGLMVMETPEGKWDVKPLRPHAVLYVPPRWAHRSVNTSADEDLVMFFAYPGNAGHDYGSIEKQGYRKLVVDRNGVPTIIDNPRWLPPELR